MVFYVIAASLPGKDENDNERTVKSALTNASGRQIGELYNVNVKRERLFIFCRLTRLSSRLGHSMHSWSSMRHSSR